MSDRLQKMFAGRTILCDGAMGTTLSGRGIFINRCYDELKSLSQPDLIRSVHEDYLQGWSRADRNQHLLRSRTPSACRGTAFRTRRLPSTKPEPKSPARAVVQLEEKQAGKAWVAWSRRTSRRPPRALGKTGNLDEACAAFVEQIRGLVAGGVDLLVIETIVALNEAEQAILAAREVAPGLPVLAMITVDEEANCLDGASPETAAARLAAAGADAIGCNCSTGPATVLTAIERMGAVTSLPLAAMPNAGTPRAVDGRNIYLCSPEYMASFARKFLKAGAQFVGGCCGTTPNHIRAIKSAIRAVEAQKTAKPAAARETIVTETPPRSIEERSKIGRLVHDGAFVTLVEIVPPRGIDCTKELDGAALLAARGIHAINVPDSPRASARMSAQSLCIQIQQKAGIETVLHYTCRDRNVLSIQSDLLGASSIGLKNILCLTGDPPKLGNYPDATAVFDVEAIRN